VTFLFRNLKEFLEQKVEGQKDFFDTKKAMIRETVMVNKSTKKEEKHQRRLALAKQDNQSLMGKKFTKLYERKSQLDSDDFINALDSRILYLKRSKKLKEDNISAFVDYIKLKFKGKVIGEDLDKLPKYRNKYVS